MEEITAFEELFGFYYQNNSPLEIFLLIWNFIGSLIIIFLAFWRVQDVNGQRNTFNTAIEFHGVKASMILIMIGALYHAIYIQIPSFTEGCTYSGLLLYLALRRVKQIRDNREL